MTVFVKNQNRLSHSHAIYASIIADFCLWKYCSGLLLFFQLYTVKYNRFIYCEKYEIYIGLLVRGRPEPVVGRGAIVVFFGISGIEGSWFTWPLYTWPSYPRISTMLRSFWESWAMKCKSSRYALLTRMVVRFSGHVRVWLPPQGRLVMSGKSSPSLIALKSKRCHSLVFVWRNIFLFKSRHNLV